MIATKGLFKRPLTGVVWSFGMPKISVCIPTFNRAHFLPEAIASVQAQGESDWELIVCDDGSRDETYQVMERI